LFKHSRLLLSIHSNKRRFYALLHTTSSPICLSLVVSNLLNVFGLFHLDILICFPYSLSLFLFYFYINLFFDSFLFLFSIVSLPNVFFFQTVLVLFLFRFLSACLYFFFHFIRILWISLLFSLQSFAVSLSIFFSQIIFCLFSRSPLLCCGTENFERKK
jgi:hypothetical protein